MHIKKKEAVNGTEEVNQVLVATVFGEVNREHLMGLNGREQNTVHRTYILYPINWDWPAALGQAGG